MWRSTLDRWICRVHGLGPRVCTLYLLIWHVQYRCCQYYGGLGFGRVAQHTHTILKSSPLALLVVSLSTVLKHLKA